MNHVVVKEEVLYAKGPLTRVTRAEIETLKTMAAANRRQRIRLCTHPSPTHAVHEMIIVHARDNYVRPHLHLRKSESFHVIEGRARVVIFDDHGDVKESAGMSEAGKGDCFFIRIEKKLYHTVIPGSRWFVFHETTQGPFQTEQTRFAPWSPEEMDLKDIERFSNTLVSKI